MLSVFSTVLELLGFAAIVAGVYVLAGGGVALLAGGLVLLVIGVAASRPPDAQRKV